MPIMNLILPGQVRCTASWAGLCCFSSLFIFSGLFMVLVYDVTVYSSATVRHSPSYLLMFFFFSLSLTHSLSQTQHDPRVLTCLCPHVTLVL